MLTFTYSVTINALPAYDDKVFMETLTGTIEAEDYAQAKQHAQSRAWERCTKLRQGRGIIFGYENVQVTRSPEAHQEERAVLTPDEYQKAALRTLYPDLTPEARLGLCGLGLSGEIGEVTDLLKKFLYHRNGKPLDVDKLKDELGDVLWYFFVLLDTLGITFEAVMMANAAKQKARHPSGFNPHYVSDSHASEVIVLHETPHGRDPSPTRPLERQEER